MRAPVGETRSRRGENAESGFTMVEVLVAIVLAAIAMIGIMALFMTENRAAVFSRHSTEAAVLAEDKIEALRTQGAAATGSATESSIDERGVAGGIFTRVYNEVAGASYATIQVVVTWTDDGLTHSVQVQARRNL